MNTALGLVLPRPTAGAGVFTLAHRLQRPVQVVWSREDDVRHDHYREAAAHLVSVAVEGSGPAAWLHRIASPSLVPT